VPPTVLSLCPQDKVVALTSANVELDAKVHAAHAEANGHKLAVVRLQQEVESLQRRAASAEEELDAKVEALRALRRATSSQARV
jgi:chromosome segregation ATPase